MAAAANLPASVFTVTETKYTLAGSACVYTCRWEELQTFSAGGEVTPCEDEKE